MKSSGESFIDEEVDGVRLSFTLSVRQYSNARNFRLTVRGKDTVLLSKPRYAPMKDALDFLRKNWLWLAEQMNKKNGLSLKEFLEKNPRIFANSQEMHVWLMNSKTGAFFVENLSKGELAIAFDTEENLRKVFVEYARKKIETLVEEVSKKNSIPYTKVRIGNQHSRWASRSSTGAVSFNWRMIFLESALQNYIVCHELSHAEFMDHSPAFWIFLGRICPNARTLDKALSKSGGTAFDIE